VDGIYDPGHPNDRLLLGLKGTMSEFELTLLRAPKESDGPPSDGHDPAPECE
jgi:hypothetical protein